MSILFCTPCYGGQVVAQHMGSCIKLGAALDAAGVEADWDLGWNESLVHRARMEMTRKYLASSYTHQMWLDADIGFTPDMVAALWNLNVDIAVGVYRMKKPDVEWFTAWKDGKLVNVDDFDGPTEVDYAGTGFMLIRRQVLETIYAMLKRRHEKAEQFAKMVKAKLVIEGEDAIVLQGMVDAWAPDYQGNEGRTPALYMTPIHNDGLESEDYHFCRLAREAGFKIIMDPNVRLTHYGQYPYGAPAKDAS